MGNNIVTFTVNIDGDAARVLNDITRTAGESTERFNGFTSALGTFRDIGLSLSFISQAWGKVAGYTSHAIEANRNYQVAATKLGQVMGNTMGARGEEIQSILDLAAAQQKLGVVSDGAQLAGAQELATYLTRADSLKKVLPAMNDMIAQQYGVNASQMESVNIATMVGKVLQGQTGALSRYGYYFDEAQEKILKFGSEEQRVAVLTDIITESVGGVNAALAATPEGKMKQQADDMDALAAKAGKVLTDIKVAFAPVVNEILASVIEPVVNGIDSFVRGFREGNPVFVAIAAVVGGLTAGLIAYKTVIMAVSAATRIWAVFQAGLNLVMSMNPVGIVIASVVAMVAVIAVCWNKFAGFRAFLITAWDTVKQFGNILKEAVIDRVKGLLEGIGAIGQAIGKLFQGDFSGAWESAKEGVIKFSGLEAVRKAAEGAGEVFGNIADNFKKNLAATSPDPSEEEGEGEGAHEGLLSEGDGGGAPIVETPELGVSTELTSGMLGKRAASATESRIKNINITIDRVIEHFTVQTTNLKESTGRIRDLVAEALIEGINDVNLSY
ncbi:MAG: hypothetical protein LBJ17_01665 [Dysgonamonadaceae bacterium]|jgi:hypothetical protein|nr:hypothetical protein [Dysgonamonadaceae bacterium]